MNTQMLSIPGFPDLSFLQDKTSQSVTSDTAELTELIKKSFPADAPLNVLDLGTGTGIIPFILRLCFSAGSFTGIDIQESLIFTAEQNVLHNHLDRIRFICDNISNIHHYPFKELFDIVVSNPPYFRKDQGKMSPEMQKAISRHEIFGGMSDFLKALKFALHKNGTAFLLYPEFREAELYTSLDLYALKLIEKYPLPGNNLKNKKFIYRIQHAGN